LPILKIGMIGTDIPVGSPPVPQQTLRSGVA